MNNQTSTHDNNKDTLIEEARALLTATADVAEEKICEARKRLAAALDDGTGIYGHLGERAVEGVKAANRTVRENPYEAIGIALGLGAIIGCLAARLCSRSGK
jgi:ElaB/YqjD/DUF883 family membrane-anchored ribosome-binding protein